MRIPVCLAFLFAVANCASFSVDRCNLDYACKNYTSAKLCDKTTECKSSYWNRAVSNGELCTVCKEEISKVQNWLAQTKTKDKIYEELINFCEEIPDSQIKADCRDLVATNFDMVYLDIIGFINPSTLCSAITLCKPISVEAYVAEAMNILPDLMTRALNEKKKIPIAAPFEVKTKVLDDSCSDCEAFLKDLQFAVVQKNDALMNFVQDTKSQCDSFGSEAEACKEHVEFFISQTVTLLAQNEDSKSVCKKLQLCKPFSNKISGDMCDDCKTFFTEWQELLKSNQTVVDSVVQAVSKLYCMQKPIELREQCTRYVSMVIKVLIDQIEREDVGKICRKLEFCDPGPQLTDLALTQEHFVSEISRQQPNGDHCTDCKNFIGDVQSAIANNASLIQELVDLVKQECAELGPELEPICKDFINKNWRQFKDMIESLDADTICTTIEMCPALLNGQNLARVEGNICDDCVAFFGDWQDIITNNKSVIDPSDICATLYFCDAHKSQWLENLHAKFQMLKAQNEKNNVECELCKLVIEEVEKLIEGNRTEEAIEKALLQVCEEIDEDLKKECMAFIDEYGPKVIDFLIQELNSLEICSKLNLCPQSRKQEILADEKENINPECGACQLVIEEVEKLIGENRTEESIVEAVDKVCEVIGDKYSEQCKKFVETYGPTLIELLIEELDSLQICTKLGLCPSSSVAKKEKADIPGVCELCEIIVKEITKRINKNATEAEIVADMNKICFILPGEVRTRCTRFVEQRGEEIASLILKFTLNPTVVCYFVKACSPFSRIKQELELNVNGDHCTDCKNFIGDIQNAINNNSSLVQELVDLVKQECSQLGPELQGICKDYVNNNWRKIVKMFAKADVDTICSTLEMCSAQSSIRPVENLSAIVNGNICDDCVAFFGDWQDIIANNKSVINNLESKVKKFVCGPQPFAERLVCDGLIEDYAPKLIDAVAKNDPSDICATLYFCDAHKPKPLKVLSGKIEPLKTTNEKDDGKCEICKFGIEEIEKLVEGNRTEENIEKALKEVCELYGEDIRQQCEQFMDDHDDAIIDFLIQELNSLEICTKLGLCATSEVQEAKEEVKESNSITCDICEVVVGELEKMIENNRTREAIKEALDRVCSIIPKTAEKCEEFVEEYGAEIIEILVKTIGNPRLVCKLIGLCTDAGLQTVENEKDGAVGCDICKVVVTEVDKLIENNRTRVGIRDALDKVCAVLPASIKSGCLGFVTEYGNELVEILIRTVGSPKIVCELLGLCPSANPQIVDNEKLQMDSTVFCDFCKLFAQELESLLDNNRTKEAVENALEKVCSVFPSDMKTDCDQLVEQYGYVILEVLVKAFAGPGELCHTIGLCSTSAMLETNNRLKENRDLKDTCTFCKLAIGEVDQVLGNDANQDAIVNLMLGLCSNFGGFSLQCQGIVSQYGKTLLQLISTEINPDRVCAITRLCTSLEDNQINSLECDVCNRVSGVLQGILKNPATVKDVETALEKVCPLLPKESQAACVDMITTYTKTITEILVDETDPTLLCKELKVCPAGVTEELKDGSNDLECKICQEISNKIEQALMKNSTESDSSPACVACEFVIQELNALLCQSTTQERIAFVLKQACTLLPGTLQTDCTTLIDTYDQAVFAIILQELVPQNVCPTVKLCDETFEVEKVDSGVSCTVCEALAQELNNFLTQSTTETKVKYVLSQACTLVPGSFQTNCVALVDTLAPSILVFLVQETMPQKICSLVRLCNGAVELDQVSSGVPCTVCQAVTQEVNNFLCESATEEKIKVLLKQGCSVIPGTLQANCVTLVDTYTPALVALLVQEVVPQKICPAIKLCDRAVDLEKVSSEVTCDVCHIVASSVESLLAKNATEKEIEDSLKAVCNKLPKDAAKCVSFVEEYTTIIINLLAEEMQPDKICIELKLCEQTAVEIKTQKDSLPTSEADCTLCKDVIGVLDTMLEDHRTEAEIEKALSTVCDVMRARAAECDSFVKQYTPELIELLIRGMDANYICIHLGLCGNSHPAVKLSGKVACEMCDFVIENVEKRLNRLSTEAEILDTVKKVCGVALDKEDYATCQLYIRDYGPGVISILVNDFVPDKVCPALHACPAKKTAEPVKKLQLLNVDIDRYCEICEGLIRVLDQVIDDKSTQEDIVKALEQACLNVPEVFVQTCQAEIAQYAPIIFKYIKEIGDPLYICEKLELCKTTVGHDFFGNNPCTAGPSYWCSSVYAAKSCGAFEHCMNHVWN